jgi:hypothetical protein
MRAQLIRFPAAPIDLRDVPLNICDVERFELPDACELLEQERPALLELDFLITVFIWVLFLAVKFMCWFYIAKETI